jgi:hypothetical protein
VSSRPAVHHLQRLEQPQPLSRARNLSRLEERLLELGAQHVSVKCRNEAVCFDEELVQDIDECVAARLRNAKDETTKHQMQRGRHHLVLLALRESLRGIHRDRTAGGGGGGGRDIDIGIVFAEGHGGVDRGGVALARRYVGGQFKT